MKNRILLASMIFDLGAASNHMYEPIVNWYFDFENKEKPILMVIKYAWQDTQKRFPFNDKAKRMFVDGGLVEMSKYEIKETYPNYEGNMDVYLENDYYISQKGKEIGFVKDFETAVKLYRK